MHLVDAHLAGDVGGGTGVVPGDQHRGQARFPQGGDGLDGFGAQRVGQRDHAEHPGVAGHRDHRVPLAFQVRDRLGRCGEVQAVAGEKAGAAHQHAAPGDPGGDAEPGGGLESSRVQRRQFQPPPAGGLEDGPGERVFGRGLGRRCDGEQFAGVRSGDGVQAGDSGPPHGEGAGLVQQHVGDLPERLEGFAGAHDDAQIGGDAGAAHDRERGGDADRARVAHHQHRQGGEHRPLHVGRPGDRPATGQPADQRQRRDGQHRRGVDPQHPVDQVQHSGLEGASVFHLPHHLGQEAF